MGNNFLQLRERGSTMTAEQGYSTTYPVVRGTLTSRVDMLESRSDKLPGYGNCHVAVIT